MVLIVQQPDQVWQMSTQLDSIAAMTAEENHIQLIDRKQARIEQK